MTLAELGIALGALTTLLTAAEGAAAYDAIGSAAAAQSASQPVDADLTSIAALTTTSFGRAYLAAADGAYVFGTVQPVNAQTGTTYTLVLTDVGKLVTLSNAAAITLTLPQDSDVAAPVGCYVDLAQIGAGQVTVVAGTGATLRVSGLTAKARAQYSRLGVQKISANTWQLFGDLAAS